MGVAKAVLTRIRLVFLWVLEEVCCPHHPAEFHPHHTLQVELT